MTNTAVPAETTSPAGTAPPYRTISRSSMASTAGITGGAWVLIELYRLFVGGAVGMGDQGDGRRLMCQVGVRTSAPFNASTSAYLYPTWIAHKWYGEACSADGAGGVFRSSELWLLSLAKHLTGPLGLPGALDLRALGVVCAVLVGVVVASFVIVLPGAMWLRVVVASLVGLLAADSAVSQFFISPYSEPAELIGTLALCAALLALWRHGHTTWASLALVGFLGAFVIGAKTQAVALVPALVAALLWLPHGSTPPGQGLWRRSPPRPFAWALIRVPALVVVAALLGATGYFLATAPVGLSQQDVYAEVFGEILIHSRDPSADLRSLGADPSLASAVGTNPESPNAATLRPAYLKFREDVTFANIVEFYLTHPTRLVSVGGDGLKGVDHWRQDYLGSYQPNSGRSPGAIENRVGVYGALLRKTPEPVLVLLWLATLYVGVRTVRRRGLRPGERAVGRLAVFVAVGAFLEFWGVMISVGFPDVYRHMILTNLLLALGLPLMIACLAIRARASRYEPDSFLVSVLGPKEWI